MAFDEQNPELIKARKKVSDAAMYLLQVITEQEQVIADLHYQDAFNDGVAWVQGEFNRLAGANAPAEGETVKHSVELTKVEEIAKDNILQIINANSGTMRTSDLITKITALPVKPAIPENTVKVLINALKREGKIDQRTGRWHATDAKKKLPDYQVMTYMPDGSKYLGSDISR